MRLQKLIFQNIFWRGLYYLSALVLNIVISRYLKAESSGWMYYLINNLSLLLLVTGISLESGATYYTSKNITNSRAIAAFCFFWAMTATIISALCLTLFPNFFSGHVDLSKEYFFASVAYVLGFLLINYFNALFFARGDFFIPNFILLASNLIIISSTLLFGKKELFAGNFIVIYFFSFLLQGLLLALIYFLVSERTADSLSFSEVKSISKYSLIALSANIIFFLVYRVDYWFVKMYCSKHDLGNYIQVSKLGQVFLLVPTMIATIIFPNTASGIKKDIENDLKALSRFLFATYFALIIIITLFGKTIFSIVYGPSFDEMYKPFILLSPGILSLSTQALLSAYFAGKNMLSVNIKGALIALVIIAFCDFWLIPSFGINAAAAISSAGYIFYMLYSILVFKNETNSNWSDFFFLKRADLTRITGIFKAE